MTRKTPTPPISLKEYLERTGRINEKCIECGNPLFYDIDGIQVYDIPSGQLHYKGLMPIHLKWLNDIPVGDHYYRRNVCWKCLFDDIRKACREQLWKTVYIKGWPREVIDGKDAFPPRAMRAIGRRLLPLIFRGVSEEDIKKNSSRYDGASLESFIKHHGEEEGRKKYKEYTAFQAAKNTYEYKHDHKGWTKKQFDEYNKSRAVTLENLQKRYGNEEGKKRFNAYCEWQAYAGCALEYFQDLYGEEEGLRKYNQVNKWKSHSLESFVEKYGEESGFKKWKEYFNKHNASYSEVSQAFFNKLCKMLSPELKELCSYATHGGEQILTISNGNTVRPDFALGKKIIEFNGNYWHCNPELYKDDLVTEDVKLIWERDKTRIHELEELGYSVLIVWELDYNKDPEGVLKKCLDFLNGGLSKL